MLKILFFKLSLFLFFCCNPVFSQTKWVHQTSIYQIYPRSFADSNQDGIGDIQGIIQKLDYIKNLGFETIWCSPFFSSPQQDFGYDISNYRDIAPEYGTMADVEQLIQEVHSRRMKIILDMVMNHTSQEHPWFQEDVQRKPEDRGVEHDFYVWTDHPNRWKSMVKGSAWQYHPIRKQYFYAAFLPFQPDLNYRNPEVQEEMLANVKFWLNKGIDGFRLDIFNSIFEDSLMRNNPFSLNLMQKFQKPKYTANLDECLVFAEKLRAVCDSFGDKMLLGEIIGDRKNSRKYCGDSINNRLTLAFDFEMLRFKPNSKYFSKLISNVENDFSNPFMPVYVFSNHDRKRSISRIKANVDLAKLIHLIQLTVRAVPCVYYGEEIGMENLKISYKTALDPIPKVLKIPRLMMNLANESLNRDEMRTPMQWNQEQHAGFSKTKPWLKVHPNYLKVNVLTQDQDSSSLLNHVRKCLNIRNKYKSFTNGDMKIIKMKSKNVLAYKRTFESEESIVLINFSNRIKNIEWESENHKIQCTLEKKGFMVFVNGKELKF